MAGFIRRVKRFGVSGRLLLAACLMKRRYIVWIIGVISALPVGRMSAVRIQVRIRGKAPLFFHLKVSYC